MKSLGTCLAYLLLIAHGIAADYPHVVLKVKNAEVTVYTPDAERGFYRGSRFAWAGVIKDFKFANHTLFGPWKSGQHNPNHNDDITGPCEEFGMFSPLGYDAAQVGEHFVKIGIGEIIKPKEAKYNFYTNYKVANAGQWHVEKQAAENDREAAIVMMQTVKTKTGIGYQYSKKIRLTSRDSEPVKLYLEHELTNRGEQPIKTDVYNHNFFNVDGTPVGPRYSLTMPQEFMPTADSKFGEVAQFERKRYTFARELEKESPFGVLTQKDGTSLLYEFTWIYHGQGDQPNLEVKVVGPDIKIAKFQTWSVRGCMCPEPFHDIDLPPGQSQKWRYEYEFRSVSRK